MDAVGSNIRIDSRGIEVMRILPRLHEEINEEWISDKTRFCYDGLKYQRLGKAYIKKNGKLEAVNFSDANQEIAKNLKSVKPSEVAILSGPMSSAEEIFALQQLAQKLGITQTESRLRDEKLSAADRASFLFNTTIAGIDNADALLLIGVNPRKDAPILNARIRKRFLSKKLKVASIGVDADLTYKYNSLGADISALKDVLNEKSDFAAVLKNAKNPMLIIGHDVLTRKDGGQLLNYAKKIAEKFNMIQDGWNGFNFLSKTAGLVNGLELGFTSSNGITEILEKTAKDEIKTVILHGVDDDIDFEKLKNAFVIYVGSHGDKGASHASVILPSATYVEKDAIFVNCEGRAQSTARAVFAPGEAKEDLTIFVELAKELGVDLGFDNLAQARAKLFEKHAHMSNFDKIATAKWQNSHAALGDLSEEKVVIQHFDFYLTNPITRASRTLNRCSSEFVSN
jgi:NADH-quinone oxidoreductase subunit G